MLQLLLVAIAPVVIIGLYVFFRDKYEKEPFSLLMKSLGAGILITIPIIFSEKLILSLMPMLSNQGQAFYHAFLVAGFTEEFFKFLTLYILIWSNRNFNEKFDGIVYAVFISLGFAAVENILYVLQNGITTGYIRAVISVPGHALFGVTMGYYFGLAKFYSTKRIQFLIRSFLYPVLLHGLFDFILMFGNYLLLIGFVPYIIFLYIDGMRRMRQLSEESIFRK
jgi:RsiW-degrading membrane proteinase PrsW (M82 family)